MSRVIFADCIFFANVVKLGETGLFLQ